MTSLAKGYMAKIGLDYSDLDKQIKSLQSELRSLDKALATNSNSATLNKQKYEILAAQYKAVTEKLSKLQQAEDDMYKASQGANPSVTAEEYRAYQRELSNTGSQVRALADELNSLTTVEDTNFRLVENQVSRGDYLNALQESQEIISNWTASIAEFGEKLGAVLGSLLQETIQVGKQFETSMSLVAATMGVDQMSEDYQKLEETAKKFGETTRYTASQAAEALNYLALAGYDADRSIEALPDVLNLARAGALDFGRASEMLTNSVSALGLTSGQMSELVDKMAVTARSSGTNVEQLGEAILTIGGTAKTMVQNGGITELTTMLGVLADNGIKGSEGGTKLRNALVKLAKPSKGTKELLETLNMDFYDLQGNLRPLPEIFTEIGEKMTEMNLSQKERDRLLSGAFNARDLAAINALVNTSAERYDVLAQKINAAAGASEQMAKTQEDNLQGALYQLTSAREAVEIEIYQKIQEPLAEIVNLAADALRGVDDKLSEANVGAEFTAAFQKIADTVRDNLPQIISLFEQFAEKVVPRLGELTAKVIEFTSDKVLPQAIELLEWIINHGEMVEGAIRLMLGAMELNVVNNFAKGTQGLVGQIAALVTNINTLSKGVPAATSAVEGAAGAATTAATAFSGYALAIEAAIAVALVLKEVGRELIQNLEEQEKAAKGLTDAWDEYVDAYQGIVSGEYKPKSLAEAEDTLNEYKQKRKELQDEEDQVRNEIEDLEYEIFYLEKSKAEYGAAWYLPEFKAKRDLLEQDKKLLEAKQNRITAINEEAKAVDNLIFQSNKLYQAERKYEGESALADRKNAARRREEEKKAQNYKSASYNAWLQSDDPAAKQERLRIAQEEAAQAEEDFVAEQEWQEEQWDKKYKWDKKNNEEYWKERRQWLKLQKEKLDEENVESQAYWESYWETEAHFAKLDDKTSKEIEKGLKASANEIKDKLTSFKNDLNLAVSSGDKTEAQANAELIHYIKTVLDPNTELYKTELSSALDKQKSIQDKLSTENKKTHDEAVKKQKEQIKDEWKQREILAKEEGQSNEWLYNEKLAILNTYKENGELYEENRKELEEDLAELHAKVSEEAEKKRQDALKKEWQRIDKTDLESQEKFLKSLSLADKELFDQYLQEYEDNLDDLIKAQEEAEQKYIDKGAAAAEKVVELYQKQTDSIAKMAESPVETFNEKTKKYEKAEQGKIYDAKTGKKRYIFANYQKKIQELKAYQANLERLKKLDLPEEMIKDIFSISDFETKALYIKELLNMSAANREKYFRDYRNFYKLSDEIGASEVNYAKKDEVQKIMDEAVRDMSEDQKYNGELAAKSWLAGFTEYMEKNGITLDVSKYTDTVGAYGAANPYAGAMTAEEIKTSWNKLDAAVNRMSSVADAMGKGVVNISIDGKNLFSSAYRAMMNKSINISDKGGVLA